MIRVITKKEFKKEVLQGQDLSIVQFKIEWSGACQIISPIYHEVAASYNQQANFFSVDVENEKGLDEEYGVMELPTILFFHKGQVVDHVKGLTPKNVLITKIENALKGFN